MNAHRSGTVGVCAVALVFAAFAPRIRAAEPLRAPFDAQAAKAAQQQWAKQLNRQVVETNSIGMKLTLIPPGELRMGSPETELAFGGKHNDDEKQHRVRITKPFYMGVYHVTLGNFLAFYHASGYKTEAETDGEGSWGYDTDGNFGKSPDYTFRNWGKAQTNDHPVVLVSWNDATEFCKWLSKKEGKTYRLPTDAEWEHACRAGTTTPFNFGSSLNGREANCKGNYPYGTDEKGPYVNNTTPVGSYRPNAFGLYDMHGNAYQWCQDWLGNDDYGNSPTNDPQGPAAGPARVTRGGGWCCEAVDVRSACRVGTGPSAHHNDLGFRVVCER
jgi:formylglycine-generating enzyme required for sulfatase activity